MAGSRMEVRVFRMMRLVACSQLSIQKRQLLYPDGKPIVLGTIVKYHAYAELFGSADKSATPLLRNLRTLNDSGVELAVSTGKSCGVVGTGLKNKSATATENIVRNVISTFIFPAQLQHSNL